MSSPRFTHLDEHGHARMVDVNAKEVTFRSAVARGVLRAPRTAIAMLTDDELLTARIAGTQAAMRTHLLVPLCHPIPVETVAIDITSPEPDVLAIEAQACANWRTGVEIEAMTATCVAALTLVCALSRHTQEARVDDIAVWSKEGGRSGAWGRSGEWGRAHELAGRTEART